MDDVMARVDEDETRRQLLVGLSIDATAEMLRDAGYPCPDLQSVELLVDALLVKPARRPL